MSIYTLVQLFEVVLFAAVLGYGILSHLPSLALLGGGLLVGKAILNILAPEGGTVFRRSVFAYAVAGIYVVVGVLLIHVVT